MAHSARHRPTSYPGALRHGFIVFSKARGKKGWGVPRRCKKFSAAALKKGARIEHREHPEFSATIARRIARDHLCTNPKHYKKDR